MPEAVGGHLAFHDLLPYEKADVAVRARSISNPGSAATPSRLPWLGC